MRFAGGKQGQDVDGLAWVGRKIRLGDSFYFLKNKPVAPEGGAGGLLFAVKAKNMPFLLRMGEIFALCLFLVLRAIFILLK